LAPDLCNSEAHTCPKSTDERERLLGVLRRSNEHSPQFSYVASHDLQAPLRIYTSLLAGRYEGKCDETADQFIPVITKGAYGIEQLIQALLRYTQAGEEAVSKTAVRSIAI
jgi:light-regulated signal transduction histidine kinase (bacteriophytochrome)